MAHIRVTDKVVEASISVEGVPTEFARSGIKSILIFSDLIRHGLILGLGATEGIRLGVVVFLQGSMVSVNS